MPGKVVSHETVTVPDVEIFQSGTYNGDPYSSKDLQDIIASSDAVGFTPVVKLGHMGDKDTDALLKHEGLPSFGYVKNLRVKGKKLLADFTDVPRRLADIINKKGYSRVSSEIYWNYKKGNEVHRRVLKAVALLGAEIPAITDLKDVEALYRRSAAQGIICAYDDNGNEFRAYQYESFYPKLSKLDVDYRIGDDTLEVCRTCKFFLGFRDPDSVGSCSIVEGEIAAEAVCNQFQASDAFDFQADGDVRKKAEEQEAAIKARESAASKQDGKTVTVTEPDGGKTPGDSDVSDKEKQEQEALKAKEAAEAKRLADDNVRLEAEVKAYKEKDTKDQARIDGLGTEVRKLQEQDRIREAKGIVDGMVRSRNIPPAAAPFAEALVRDAISQPRELTYGEKDEKADTLQVLKQFLEAMGKVVTFEELSKAEGVDDRGQPVKKGSPVAEQVNALVKKYQADHPEFNKAEKYGEAMQIVLDQNAELKKQYAYAG